MLYNFSHGAGTQQSPFEIWSADDLNGVRDHPGAYFLQKDHIDLVTEVDWNPIGENEETPFVGFYNGNGFEVQNLTIDKSSVSNVGLFGYVGDDEQDYEIKHVILRDCNVVGNDRVGALVGFAVRTRIYQCAVYDSTIVGNGYGIGSLAGTVSGANVEMCYGGNIHVEGSFNVGGLIGEAGFGRETSVLDCFATGSLSTDTGALRIGGLLGAYDPELGDVIRCYAAVAISGEEIVHIGGLVGSELNLIDVLYMWTDDPAGSYFYIQYNEPFVAPETIAGNNDNAFILVGKEPEFGYLDGSLGPLVDGDYEVDTVTIADETNDTLLVTLVEGKEFNNLAGKLGVSYNQALGNIQGIDGFGLSYLKYFEPEGLEVDYELLPVIIESEADEDVKVSIGLEEILWVEIITLEESYEEDVKVQVGLEDIEWQEIPPIESEHEEDVEVSIGLEGIEWVEIITLEESYEEGVEAIVGLESIVWQEQFDIYFLSNDGDTEPDPNFKHGYDGEELGTLPSPPTKADYFFGGWNTNAEGTGAIINASTIITQDYTLYAMWLEFFTVTFDNNGGDTEADPQSKEVPDGYSVDTLPIPPTRSEYTFVGWNTQADGNGTTFGNETAVMNDITVYAQWEEE